MRNGGRLTHRPPKPGFLSGHLVRRLALAVFASALVIAVIGVAGGALWLRAAAIEALRSDVSAIVRGAINPRSYPTLDELKRTGEHLVRSSDILGGSFVTGVGVERASFGEPPELNWAQVRLEGISWRIDPLHRIFETFIPPEEIGLGYGLVVKVATDTRRQAAVERLALLLLIGLAAALALATAAAFIARRLIARRVAAVEAALVRGLAAPEEAGDRLSHLKGGDEVARLSRQADRLLTLLSTLLKSDVAAANAMIERCPFPLVIIAPDGRIARANDPALRLFEVPSVDRLPGDGGTLCLYEGEPLSPLALLSREALHGPGEVILPKMTIPVRIGVDTMHGPDGTLLGAFVMLIDVRDMVADMRHQVMLREEARERQRRAEVELARLRAQFEACLVILEHEQGHNPLLSPATVDPAPLVERWLERAVKRGEMSAGGVAYQSLPLLRVDPEAARRLFQFLFDAVRRRSGQRMPSMLFTGSKEGAAARLTVRAAAAADGALCEPIAADNESTLLVGAIAVLAQSMGGRLAAERIGEMGNGITVLLPLEMALAQPGTAQPAPASAA